LRPRVDLNLVANTLRALDDSAYFDGRVHEFTRHFIGAIEHVLANPGKYDAAIETSFAWLCRNVQSYLSGSTNNEIPFEVVYCLTDALGRWRLSDAAIVTSLTEDHNFHLKPLDPWQFIETSITDYDAGGFRLPVVMIGVPRIYAHKPIFCIPLFHELGHFVDIKYRITQVSAILNPAPIAPAGANDHSYRMEHFADLFGASYVGRSSIAALEAIAPNAAATESHPATADRVALVDAFLAGTAHPTIDLMQNALSKLGLPTLTKVFDSVDVTPDFDDVRTFVPSSIEQVYGMFDSAWAYLFNAIDRQLNPWQLSDRRDGIVEALVNDLTEKSIRNFAIREAWDAVASSP
jgi:hypothetical protein